MPVHQVSNEPAIVGVEALRGGWVLLDSRPAAAYAAGHLPGALHADPDRDLAAPAPDPARGGRHPLPDAAAFGARVAAWGIGPDTPVAIYDDQGGANAAARAWWMLRSLGNRFAALLDGGLQGAGLPLDTEVPVPVPVAPWGEAWHLPTVGVEAVDELRRDAGWMVLDVRAAFRYRGEGEPIDPVAGHIPGARNLPFAENLGREGRFLAPEVLRARYLELLGGLPPERLVVHCGSGVTACHTLVALERAGLPGASLYVGSWSEWCRTERPVATGA